MSNTPAYVMKEVNAMGAGTPSSTIHTTLPMEQLIEIVESEIRGIVNYDSFEYSNEENSSHIFFGTPRIHKCQYRIYIGGVSLGKIILTRSILFEEDEINLIEGALGSLIIHLNNAMDHQSDLSDEAIETLRIDKAFIETRN